MEAEFWLIILMIIFSAFFSGMEMAFVSANKMRVELDKKQGSIKSKILSVFTSNPGKYIATMLVGNNIALVIYGIVFAKILKPILEQFAMSSALELLTQTILSTLLILVTAEFIPKTLFRVSSNGALNVFAFPVFIFYIIFYPITTVTIWFSKVLLKTFFKTEESEHEKVVFSRIDLDHFINELDATNEISEEKLDNEIKLFRNALDFSKVKLRETMVPRTEIKAIELGTSIEELKQKFIETGHSRILFYKDNIDNIVGYIHQAVLFSKPEFLQEHMSKVLIVPETMPASKLLSKFIQQRHSIAIVVDEFGGTAGMVTLEDILEEIFGEIEDEHDTNVMEDQQVAYNEYVLSARLELDYLYEKYKMEFPESESYETLAGFILYYYESIPAVGAEINIINYKFMILEATGSRIEKVKMTIVDDKKQNN